MASKIIGTETVYTGTEMKWMTGKKVKVLAILKDCLSPNYNPDSEQGYCDHDSLFTSVTSMDRVEVQMWSDKENRYSFVRVDPKACDLQCFAHLNN
jgi:hypothetical protein